MPTFEDTFETVPFAVDPGERVLVAHAHPDDCVVASGGLLKLLVEQGAEVHTLTATDGEKSTKGDADFVSRGRREEEDTAAFRDVFRIPEDQQHRLRLPDGGLHEPRHFKQLVHRLSWLMVGLQIDTVITPGPEGFDGHGDHRAIHRGARIAAHQWSLLQRPLYTWGLEAPSKWRAIAPVDYDIKMAAVDCHESQFSQDPKIRAEQLSPYTRLLSGPEEYGYIPTPHAPQPQPKSFAPKYAIL
jgi:LmbE family N-acetylglucosaminyl deacetylase